MSQGAENWQTGSGAVSRYKLSQSHKLSWYRELYYLQMSGSGFKAYCYFVNSSSKSKKHDKQLTFIVRVSWREYVKIGIDKENCQKISDIKSWHIELIWPFRVLILGRNRAIVNREKSLQIFPRNSKVMSVTWLASAIRQRKLLKTGCIKTYCICQ